MDTPVNLAKFTEHSGGYSQPTQSNRGTPGRFTIPTNHYMIQSDLNAFPLSAQEELIKVGANILGNQYTALIDSGSQRTYITSQVMKDLGITSNDWNPSSVKITYGNKQTSESKGSIILDMNIEGIILKSRTFEILDVLQFSIIIGLDTMKAESMFTGYYQGHQFLEIRGTRIYFTDSGTPEPFEIDEEILPITEKIYEDKMNANERNLLLTLQDQYLDADYQQLDKDFIKQVSGDPSNEPDLVWIRGQLFDLTTNQLKEPIINISSEIDH